MRLVSHRWPVDDHCLLAGFDWLCSGLWLSNRVQETGSAARVPSSISFFLEAQNDLLLSAVDQAAC